MKNKIPNTQKKSSKKALWHFWACKRCETGEGHEETRDALLLAAYEEIQQRGFQSASLSQILKRAGVTKGALYHYFASKRELGLAMLDEIVRKRMLEYWVEPLLNDNPIDVMMAQIKQSGKEMTLEDIRLGCPLANLSQEMSPLDEGFREQTESIFTQWRQGLAQALENGQQAGQVRKDIDTEAMAVMLVASLEGCLASAKSAQSREILLQCGSSLLHVLENLKT